MGLLDEAEAAALIERSIAAAAAAHRARPDRSEPAELRRRLEDLADRRSSRVVESHGAEPR
jgi:hypothetical protein